MQIGGSPAVAAHTGKFMGIRNGIDLDIWDPENDGLLPLPYTASNVVEVSQSVSYASAIRSMQQCTQTSDASSWASAAALSRTPETLRRNGVLPMPYTASNVVEVRQTLLTPVCIVWTKRQ